MARPKRKSQVDPLSSHEEKELQSRNANLPEDVARLVELVHVANDGQGVGRDLAVQAIRAGLKDDDLDEGTGTLGPYTKLLLEKLLERDANFFRSLADALERKSSDPESVAILSYVRYRRLFSSQNAQAKQETAHIKRRKLDGKSLSCREIPRHLAYIDNRDSGDLIYRAHIDRLFNLLDDGQTVNVLDPKSIRKRLKELGIETAQGTPIPKRVSFQDWLMSVPPYFTQDL